MTRLLCGLILFVSVAPAQVANYYTITTIAGQYPLGDGGPASSALLFGPRNTAIGANGDIYIADSRNRSVRRVNSNGVIANFLLREGYYDIATDPAGGLFAINEAGSYVYRISALGIPTLYAGNGRLGFGGDGARATLASMSAYNIAADARGNLYIADADNDRIRKVTTDGVINTIAGSATFGSSGDGGPATSAQLNTPQGVAVDRNGTVYIADTFNSRIRRVSIDGTISTIAGTGSTVDSGDGGNAALAGIPLPTRVSVDTAGNLYVVTNNRVRRISASGTISAFAGSGERGFSGDGGPAVRAAFNSINGVTPEPGGSVLICDRTNDRVRRVSAQGIITTVVGTGHFVGDGGPATAAIMKFPQGLLLNSDGTLFIADVENNRVRFIDPQGVMNTLLGNGVASFADGPLAAARVTFPYELAADRNGNGYLTEAGNRIRKLTPAGNVVTIAGTGVAGFGGDDSPATVARLNSPGGMFVDANSNIYFADTNNHRVRKIDPTGIITTVAGTGTAGFSGDGGRATQARLNSPFAVTLDRAGILYIADAGNNRVRKVDGAGNISTIAGDGTCCTGGDNGPALSAKLGFPSSVLLDTAGNLYVATYNGNQIRRIGPDGNIVLLAGTGDFGFSGDGGLANNARLDGPISMVRDAAGNIYFSDQYNHRIRRISPLIATSLDVVRGDNQIAPTGSKLPVALTVRAVTRDGLGVPGVAVTFTVTSGPVSISAERVVTASDGSAAVNATFGDAAGDATVRAVASGLQSVEFKLTATGDGAPPPPPPTSGDLRLLSAVSGGQSEPPLQFLAPNSQVYLTGENFVAAANARTLTLSDLADGRLPRVLSGVCVNVAGAAAPIFSATPARIGIVMPDSSGDVPVQVVTNCGGINEALSNTITAAVFPVSPEFFYGGAARDGRRPVLMLDADNGSRLTAIAPGDRVLLSLTGLGGTDPVTVPGELAQAGASLVESIRVTIGGVELAGENLSFAGGSALFPGVYDLRLTVPPGTADGDVSITVSIAGIPSPDGSVLVVRRKTLSGAGVHNSK